MEDSKNLKEKFDELKTSVSDYYPGEYYKRLRCCLYGIVNGAELNKTGVGCHLFNTLEIQGVISPTNVKLLAEITELTDVKGAIDCIKKYKRDNNVEDSEGKILTPYRRGLVKALMCAGEDELNNVVGNYIELNPYKFDNLWDAVFKLEKERLLEDNPDSIQRFANLLKEDTKALFLGKTDVHVMQVILSGTSASSFSANQHSASSGLSVSSTSPATQQDERIRKYLLEHQKIKCSNYNRFTPPIMQTRFQVDIAHMFTDLDLLEEMIDGKQNAKPTNLDDLLGNIKEKPACKILIEGEGGIGKTTLLRYLAYNWSTVKSDKQPFKGKIVFMINIRDIGEREDALDVIVKHIKLKDFRRKARLPEDPTLIEQFILDHDDEIVLMLDGLDELKTGSESPISLFKKEEFQRSVVILTSRSENINEYIKNSDVHVKVKGFSEKKVKEYINKYFEFNLQLGDSLVKKLSIGEHPELWSMCRNPMLLLLTCIMWEEKQNIPSDKTDLFREIFRCILNQYKRDESKPKIHRFEDIPKQYVDAMCLLGHCMYYKLKKNQLSINKTDLVGDDDLIAIALKLGFLYKDESFLKTSFEETYAPPHKLIVESLVGFYLYKVCENTLDMPTYLLLDDIEWKRIRQNCHLENARPFALGFLGLHADKFLKHWITNTLSTYRSLATYYIPLVKEEHAGAVMKALNDYLANSNLEIKQHLPDVCRSLRLLINKDVPNTNILQLIREVYNSENSIGQGNRFTGMSLREIGMFLAHFLVAVKDQQSCLELMFNREFDEQVFRYFINECKKLQINYVDVNAFTLTATSVTNSSYFVYLLTHSPNLTSISFSCKGNTDIFLNHTMNIISNIKGCVLKIYILDISENNLSNISGTSLASLMEISPNLIILHMQNCNLTGDIINDITADFCSRGIKLSLIDLNISDNDFSNINGTSLASLMEISPNLGQLKMSGCNLTGDVINDMMTHFSSRGIRLLHLRVLHISDNNFSNINGTSLASLMETSPKLNILCMLKCNLTGDVINETMTDCSSRGIKLLELLYLDISNNNFRNLNSTFLASLMEISPKLNTLIMTNCNLTGDVINYMMTDCSSRGMKLLQLDYLDISNNDFSKINSISLTLLMEILPAESDLIMNNCSLPNDINNDIIKDSLRIGKVLELNCLYIYFYIRNNNFTNNNGTSLASLMDISTKLRKIELSDCNLTGDVINKMTDCSCRDIKLFELYDLNISNNNFSNLNGTLLASLMKISPKLKTLEMQNCNLTGDVINDMKTDCSSRRITFIA